MSRKMKGLLWIVMAAAAALTILTGSGILRDSRKVREMTRELAESRARWEDTAARKEALQEELKTVTEALREANLTIEESTARAEELREDIAQLEKEIEELKNAAP